MGWTWSYECDVCDPHLHCGTDREPYNDLRYDTLEEAIAAEANNYDVPSCWKPTFFEEPNQ